MVDNLTGRMTVATYLGVIGSDTSEMCSDIRAYYRIAEQVYLRTEKKKEKEKRTKAGYPTNAKKDTKEKCVEAKKEVPSGRNRTGDISVTNLTITAERDNQLHHQGGWSSRVEVGLDSRGSVENLGIIEAYVPRTNSPTLSMKYNEG